MFRTSRTLAVLLTGLFILGGCVSPSGDTAHEKRHAVQKMKNETLANLYTIQPQARKQIRNAAGYAVFSNVGVNVIFFSAGSGYGVVQNNRTNEKTYMKMVSGGVGIGFGVKDFRGVFVFTTLAALNTFTEQGWDASAQADAAAKAGKKGMAWAGAVDIAPGIKLYQLTENGLALQATIQGTKYWKADDLNS